MNDVMFPEPMDPMDRAMQRMDKKAWAEADAEIATLKARLAEAERDAARYRWLRDPSNHVFVTRHVGGATIPRYVGATLDLLMEQVTAYSADGVTGNCGLCGLPRADHAEVAPDGKPECRMKCKRCGDTGWLTGDPVLGISDEPCGCDENWEE